MNRNMLAEQLQGRLGCTRSMSLNSVNAMMEILAQALSSGNDIFLRGFGTFRVAERKARKARDIRHDRVILVPAHKFVKFIPCQQIKDNLNNEQN